MKIELKSIKHSESLSEETNAFTADLWVDGKKVGFCKNQGHGGGTYITHYDNMRDELGEVERYCSSLPDVESHGIMLSMDLEFKVDILLDDWLKNKELKKNQRKGIVYIDKTGTERILSWKGWNIPKLMKIYDGKKLISKTVNELNKKGFTVLNTNI